MLERRCFVISAFGDNNSPNLEDRETWRIANAIKDDIIDSAMRQVTIELQAKGQGSIIAQRGDRDPTTGKITEAIYRSIRGDQVLIAVLLRTNENVAYEIGLAHAMGRPVIILRYQRYKVGFDLDQDRRIDVSSAALDRNDPAHEAVVADLCAQVHDLISANATPAFISNKFYWYAAPFARCIPFDRMRVPMSEWSNLLLEAEEEIWLSGHTLQRLFESTNTTFSVPKVGSPDREPANIRDILLSQLVKGCDVNIVIMDKRSPSLERRVLGLEPNDPSGHRKLSRLRSSIDETEEIVWGMIDAVAQARSLARSPGRAGMLRFTKVRFGQISNRVLMSERRAYVTPIFHSFAFNTGPSFETFPRTKSETNPDDRFETITFYLAVRDDLRQLQKHNTTVTVHPNGTIEGDRPTPPSQDGASHAE